MNKQEFLKELQNRIHILAEAEQQDILAEYAQHIDLRTAAGLTEEEAIRDFGDLGLLAAEILEAYHVDPAQLDQAAPAKPPLLPALSRTLRKTASSTGGFFRRLGGGIASFFRRAGRSVSAGLRRCAQALKRLFRPRPKPDASSPEPMKEEPPVNPTTTIPSHPARLGAGQTAKRAVRALGRFCKAALRLLWNLALVLCALPFGLAGMAALICIGLLAVLLIQGYPLAGILLCCLGGVLCCAAVLGLLFTLVWRRPLPASAGKTADQEDTSARDASAPPSALIFQTVEAEIAAAPRQVEEGEVNGHA